MKTAIFLSVALLLPVAVASANADVRYNLDSPQVVASLDHEALPAAAVDLLYHAAQHGQRGLKREQVTARLIENRLLGNYARQTYGDDTLFDDQRVGFSEAVDMENQLVSTLQAGLEKPLQQAMMANGGVKACITREYTVNAADFDKVFGPDTATRLEFTLDPTHEALAKNITVLSYHFPGGADASISLGDIYSYQNVQGRNMMFGRDSSYIADQAKLLLEHRFILDWAARRSGLGPQDIAFVRQAVLDRARRDELEHYMGLDQNLEEGTAYLRQLRAAVTAADVQAFYQSHKNNFKQIDRARARHIEVADEQQARDIYTDLDKGGDFAAEARAHSLAADGSAGGEMGWVNYPKDQNIPWLLQLVFTQQPGALSRPVRTPVDNGQAHWQIVQVEDRVESYLPADSNEVRFAASESLARIRAGENFRSLRQQLLSKADIQANPQFLPINSLQF